MTATAGTGRSRDLRALFDPRSIAVLGASNNPGKWGYWLTRGALRGAGRRTVVLINRTGENVLGHTAYQALSEAPEAPELVVTAIPFTAFEGAVDDALAAGA